MIKPLTLSQRLLERADASDEDCRTDDGDIMREADEALKAKDAEIEMFRNALAMAKTTKDMLHNNREMWKSQVERQSASISQLRETLQHIAKQWPDSFAALHARSAIKELDHA